MRPPVVAQFGGAFGVLLLQMVVTHAVYPWDCWTLGAAFSAW